MGNIANLNGIVAPVLSASSTTASVALSNLGSRFIEVYNSGAVPVFIVSGNSSVTATFPTTSASFGRVIPPGAVVSYERSPEHTHVAGITAAGSAQVYLTTAQGI